jgi:oligopeptide/dipeptide ABC transporter ATP-binding protein
MTPPLLEVKDLKTYFFLPEGVCRAVDGVSYTLQEDETLGIVGESGCGKSVSALSILRLIQSPGKIVNGHVFLNGKDLIPLPEEEMRKTRGNRISMIFQEPMTSLNPVFTVGFQLSETLRLHQRLSRKEARQQSIEMLRIVRIPDPEKRVDEYPHNLSGGMRQRVMIAMALCCNPAILIADEPTTALDVTIQAQILDLMAKLKEERKMSILLITHDLGMVAEVAQRVIVMYAGKIVEMADVDDIFNNPLHPYTQGLYESLPNLEKTKRTRGQGRKEPLREIPGIVPSPLDVPRGCRFSNRCQRPLPVCTHEEPPTQELGRNHWVACWLQENGRA